MRPAAAPAPATLPVEHAHADLPCVRRREPGGRPLLLELRRAAARALNDAIVESGTTRARVARISGIDYAALTLVCTARRSMDVELLKTALRTLGRDWRGMTVRFEEAFDHRGRGLGGDQLSPP